MELKCQKTVSVVLEASFLAYFLESSDQMNRFKFSLLRSPSSVPRGQMICLIYSFLFINKCTYFLKIVNQTLVSGLHISMIYVYCLLF